MKYIELKNLARKAFPCKIFQGKKLPCKILQGKNFFARSCKEQISLQDLARNEFPCKILQVIAFLQGSCKILARNAFFLNQGTVRSCGFTFDFLLFEKKTFYHILPTDALFPTFVNTVKLGQKTNSKVMVVCGEVPAQVTCSATSSSILENSFSFPVFN